MRWKYILKAPLLFQQKHFNMNRVSKSGVLSFQLSVQTIIPSKINYEESLKSSLEVSCDNPPRWLEIFIAIYVFDANYS